ncbi:hypothetical protein Tco_0734691 [Tanacetum coccineum]
MSWTSSVRPRDLNRLLANFKSALQEITVIATDLTLLPPDAAADEVGGKAVELSVRANPTYVLTLVQVVLITKDKLKKQ